MSGKLSGELVTITIEEYNRLTERSQWLDMLEGCGVDNWQGYDDAQELFDQFNEGASK